MQFSLHFLISFFKFSTSILTTFRQKTKEKIFLHLNLFESEKASKKKPRKANPGNSAAGWKISSVLLLSVAVDNEEDLPVHTFSVFELSLNKKILDSRTLLKFYLRAS